MGTALLYLLVVVAVAAAVFGIAAAVFGRGEELAPLPPGATPARLPTGDVAGDDVRALRFPQAVRGYRMADVDWVLERLAAELDRTAAERDHLRARLGEPDGGLRDEGYGQGYADGAHAAEGYDEVFDGGSVERAGEAGSTTAVTDPAPRHRSAGAHRTEGEWRE